MRTSPPLFIKRTRAKGGFTLIELLLGLAITAIIGVCVYNIFWSAMKLEDKMRHVHEDYLRILMTDLNLTHDLENAIKLDFSASYPDAMVFEGSPNELAFLTQTATGIKRVRYYVGGADKSAEGVSAIGRVVNPSSASTTPVATEFLWRQQSSLADWLNQSSKDTVTEMIARGLKPESFNCRYAAYVKELHMTGEKGLDYEDSWDKKGLPMAVWCQFALYDPKDPQTGPLFDRQIFLAPVDAYHEQ